MQNDQQFLANTGMELLAFIGISDFNGAKIFYESALHLSLIHISEPTRPLYTSSHSLSA